MKYFLMELGITFIFSLLFLVIWQFLMNKSETYIFCIVGYFAACRVVDEIRKKDKG